MLPFAPLNALRHISDNFIHLLASAEIDGLNVAKLTFRTDHRH